MISTPGSHNGNGRGRVAVAENARHRDPVTRVASWVVDVAIAKLIPDHATARLRRRLRDSDDRLERTAHQFTRRRFDAARTDHDRDAR